MTFKNIITLSVIFSISLITFVTCSNVTEDKPSDKSEVELNWKLPEGEQIKYETVME